MRRGRARVFLAGVVGVGVALALAAGCGGDNGENGDGQEAAPEATPLRVLVTNDDGVDAPGLAELVDELQGQPGLEVTVVAPADERSGTGGQTTPVSPDQLSATETETAGGYPATAVGGFPADTVAYALSREGSDAFDLVISGINAGQNLGSITEVSGTVGAARAAGAQGIPALAVSQGLGDPPDFDAGVREALAWLDEHRDELTGGEVVNLNVPTCTIGEVRGVVEVPLAATSEGAVGASDCTSTVEDPPDDITAFTNGYATRTELAVA